MDYKFVNFSQEKISVNEVVMLSVHYAETVFGVRHRKNSVYAI